MAFYCQNMIEMALILAEHDPAYEEYAFTFLQHFMWIAYAMDRIGEHNDEMWDEEDGFFYDVLRLPDGSAIAPEGPLHGRACCRSAPARCSRPRPSPGIRRLMELIALFSERYPEVIAKVAPTDEGYIGHRDVGCSPRSRGNGSSESSATCSTRTSS